MFLQASHHPLSHFSVFSGLENFINSLLGLGYWAPLLLIVNCGTGTPQQLPLPERPALTPARRAPVSSNRSPSQLAFAWGLVHAESELLLEVEKSLMN